MEHLAEILNHLHRAFGTITDVSVLARLRSYGEIGVGPIVTEKDRVELMLAVKQKHWITACGKKISLKADGRAVLAFVNAYRDRYNALWSDMVKRDEEETNEILRAMIARTIITQGEDAAKQMLVDISNSEVVFTREYTGPSLANHSIDTMYIDGIKADLPGWVVRGIAESENDPEVNARENSRLVREYFYTRDNLVEVLAQTFREYDGKKLLIEFVQERYAPCGEQEKEIVNAAYKAAKKSNQYAQPS